MSQYSDDSERRSPAQDRKALFELRQRLFAQGLDLLAASSDSTSQPDVAPSAASNAAVSIRASVDDAAPRPQQDPEVEPEEDDASMLIRRRLFAQHPSHNPLDTTVSSLSDGGGDVFPSPDCSAKLDGRKRGWAPVDAPRESVASTLAPPTPDARDPPSASRLSASGSSPYGPCEQASPSPSADWRFAADASPDGTEECLGRGAHAASSSGAAAEQLPVHSRCELRIEDVAQIKDFERLNEQLRRHGFGVVPHCLEAAAPLAGCTATRLTPVVDASGVWGLCSEVLAAYEDRGRRLRDALLAERADDRRSRDKRIGTLLQENQRLGAELQKMRETPAWSSTPSSSHSPVVAARAQTAEKELSEMVLKLKAAEALARHRERDLEQLRTRWDQAVNDGARRQEREREALAKPLRRRAATRDDPLLAVAVAHQARAEALQAELTSLTKHSHTLTFQLEASQEKCRKLEGQQQFGAPSRSQSSEARPEDPTVDQLRQATARQAELRSRAEEELKLQAITRAQELQALGQRLHELEAKNAELETEKREAGKQPSSGELRWQKEALRLRDEVVEARKAWRSADPRALMRRDKEIQSLGLAPRLLEETVKKTDLVALILDVCRLLKVGDLTQVLPKVSAVGDLLDFHSGVEKVLLELGEAPPQSAKAEEPLHSLQRLAAELRDLRAKGASMQAAAAKEKEASAPKRADPVAEEGIRALAAELRLPHTAAPSECLQRVTELRIGEAVLEGLTAQLRCQDTTDLPQRLDALFRLCDQRLAAQRIVDALQKLLRADSIDEVLPAFREVLDVAALRRRAVEHGSKGADNGPCSVPC